MASEAPESEHGVNDVSTPLMNAAQTATAGLPPLIRDEV